MFIDRFPETSRPTISDSRRCGGRVRLSGTSVSLKNNKILNLIIQKQLSISQWVVFSEWYLKSWLSSEREMWRSWRQDYPYQPDTKRQRCAANPTHYPWLQSLTKTRRTYFHTRQNWTIMVYINYRIVSRLSIKRKIVIPHFSLYSTITGVSCLGLQWLVYTSDENSDWTMPDQFVSLTSLWRCVNSFTRPRVVTNWIETTAH